MRGGNLAFVHKSMVPPSHKITPKTLTTLVSKIVVNVGVADSQKVA